MTCTAWRLHASRLVLTSAFILVGSLSSIVGRASAATPNDGWRMFVNNQPLEALKTFEKLAQSDDAAEAAAAYRGMSAVLQYLGRNSPFRGTCKE